MAREYRDSGIEWIGQIPKEWGVARFKFVSEMYTGNSLNEQQKELYSDSEVDETLPYIATKDVERDVERIDYEGGIRIPLSTDKFSIAPKNSVLLCIEGGSAGKKVGYTNQDVYFVNKLCCVRTDKNSRYFYYFILSHSFSEPFLQNIQGLIGGVSISVLKNFAISIPPLFEQQKIADYLDKVCGEVDEMVVLQEKMIEELKAYKQSVITEAVTKGLNPNTPMRNSGIDWIGDIPEHWEVKKLKYIIDYIESGTSVNAGNVPAQTNEFGVLKTSAVSKYVFDATENKTVVSEEMDKVSCPVRKNTIIVSRMNTPELVGACGYVENDYNNIFLPDRLWQVHFVDTVYVKYIWYALRGSNIRNYYSSLSVGSSSSMQNISQSQFSNGSIPIPYDVDEQRAIVSYLDTKCSEIDSLIALKQAKIEELKEYKKSVIYEYVTGKKEVC